LRRHTLDVAAARRLPVIFYLMSRRFRALPPLFFAMPLMLPLRFS